MFYKSELNTETKNFKSLSYNEVSKYYRVMTTINGIKEVLPFDTKPQAQKYYKSIKLS